MKTGAEYYGLAVYRVQNQDYAVGTQEEVNKAVAEVIRGELHGFHPGFLAGILVRYNPHSRPFSIAEIEEALDSLLSTLGEEALPLLQMIVGPAMGDLMREAVKCDGRAPFLSPVHHEEYRSDDIAGLPKGKLAFKIPSDVNDG